MDREGAMGIARQAQTFEDISQAIAHAIPQILGASEVKHAFYFRCIRSLGRCLLWSRANRG